MKDPIIAAQRVVSTAALYEIDIAGERLEFHFYPQ